MSHQQDTEENKYQTLINRISNENRCNILVLALIYSAGTKKDNLIKPLKKQLIKKYKYKDNEIKMINIPKDFIESLYKNGNDNPYHQEDADNIKKIIQAKIDKGLYNKDDMEKNTTLKNIAWGTCARELMGSHIFAKRAIEKIFQNEDSYGAVLKKREVYIIQSLKHESEFTLLQTVFGKNFFAISIYQDREQRLDNMEDFEETIDALDRKEPDSGSGQNVSDVFHRGHFFASLSDPKKHPVEEQVERFLKIIFGHAFTPPTEDEYGNFMAFSAALKTMDLSRQIGAVVLHKGDVIALGANDVQAQGRPYWSNSDQPDFRDYQIGFEPNSVIKKEWAEKIYNNIEQSFPKDQKYMDRKDDIIQHITSELTLTEFGRIVHAEMDAILSAARRGQALMGATLYSTTLPCHNCAKHIVASGITRIVFVEPYDKSKLLELHPDSLTMDKDCADNENKTLLTPFIGFGYYKFRDYFATAGRGFKGGINRKELLEDIREKDKLNLELIEQVVSGEEDPAIKRYDQQWPDNSVNKSDDKKPLPRYFSFRHEIEQLARLVIDKK